ncbi:alpha/beta hydrolase [Actinoplanes sp. NPDC051851]|uniref:alpha/beta fold hydrolase n=1 Tax=Actinoplanes sp. NPDC051851 TaxID=3154753 RepID=UPI00342E2692
MQQQNWTTRRITAADGAEIALHSTGSGPGIAVVHGGGVTIGIYRRLAAALADRFTVHLYNRRGRADAAPRPEPYDGEFEITDLSAVLEQTGTRNVIGHSAGGFFAMLAASRGLPIDRLALYDPALQVSGLAPWRWLPDALEAARAGDLPRTMAITSAGINTHSPASRLPLGVQIAMCRLFLRTPIGRMMGDLFVMTLDETVLIGQHDGPPERWAGITAETLFTCGGSGPPYYQDIQRLLVGALPNARGLVIPKCGHDGINRAPARVVEPFADFFTPARTPVQ